MVRGVDKVDSEKREIWFRAGGIRESQDPYYIHYCRVNFDGSGLKVLTEGNGTHSIQYSPNRAYFIDSWSRVDLAPVHELRDCKEGKLICKLEEADASELTEKGWQAPEPFVAKGRDGTTDIYGIIHRPRNLDETKKYPVIESIYAGPHDSFVPKGFRASYGQEKLTKLGFVVVQIDGMGIFKSLEEISRCLLEEYCGCRFSGSNTVDESGSRKISMDGPKPSWHLWHFGRRAKRIGRVIDTC